MKALVALLIIIAMHQSGSAQSILDLYLQKINTYENLNRKLPLTEKYYTVVNEASSANTVYKNNELNLKLDQTKEIRSTDNIKYISTTRNTDGSVFCTVTDSLDEKGRLVKRTTVYPTAPYYNEFIITTLNSDGNIVQSTMRKCAKCKIESDVKAELDSQGKIAGYDFDNVLGSIRLDIVSKPNKTEYIQYQLMNGEILNPSIQNANTTKFKTDYAYKSYGDNYDSLVVYKYNIKENKLFLVRKEITSKSGMPIEVKYYNSDAALEDHYKIKYNQKGLIESIESVIDSKIYNCEFDSEGRYIKEYLLDPDIKIKEFEYNIDGTISKIYELNEFEENPSKVCILSY